MRALGNTDELTLVRAHDPAGGSRYELGLGVELAGLTTAALDRMGGEVARLADSGIPELALLAQAADPRPGAEDPAGRWLFEMCGLRTVHLLGDEHIHLSPLPSQGLRLEGPAELGVGTVGSYEARYHAAGSAPGVHVRALEAADDAVARLAADGLTPLPDLLTPAQLRDALTALSSAPAAPTVPDGWQVLAASGVMTTDSRALASAVLAGMNLDQVVAFALSAANVAALGTGDELRDAVAGRIDALLRSGFYTVRCVVDTSGRLLVLASVSVLPGASGKVGEPPPASFTWHTTRLPKPLPGSLGPARLEQGRGGRAQVRALEPGLALLVCIGYARRGLADPFEIRVEPASDDTILTLDQYGYLMNLLEALYPIGIEINTFAIRRNHVDADGDGVPEFLSSRVSRTYNRYRHARPVTGARPRNRRGDSP
jgi:hypothetical protein